MDTALRRPAALIVVILLLAFAQTTEVRGHTPDAAHIADPPELPFKVYLPGVNLAAPAFTCPLAAGAVFDAINPYPPPSDRPAALHADLNLALRGYAPYGTFLGMIDYDGDTDGHPPQLANLFAPARIPGFAAAFRVHDWDWACGDMGCRGPLLSSPEVTMLSLVTERGEPISSPDRAQYIEGPYITLVLYAEEQRITLKYTMEDNVISGYTVHLEQVCVDPNLLALYRQTDHDGRVVLPALRRGQPLGVASGDQIRVAVRDCGAIMDPRSRKDWWMSLPYNGPLQVRSGTACGERRQQQDPPIIGIPRP